jgi:hypothetical protein
MDFQERLRQAVQRGEHARDARGREEAKKALSAEDHKALHSQYRLELSERIVECLQRLADQFPGFRYESIVGEEGWGASINRDDISVGADRKAANQYSRLQLLIRPLSDAAIVELVAKATIRNREVFNRSRYQLLGQVDTESFAENIDLWVLEYAEKYAACE